MIKRLGLAMAALAFAISPTAAQVPVAAAEDAPAWLRSVPAQGNYSVETPCSKEALAEAAAAPLVVNGIPVDTGSGVSCMSGDLLFSSGVLSVPKDAIGDEVLYDYVTGLLAEEGVKDTVKINQMVVDGRRMLTSREVVGSEVAQTTMVEISNRSLLLMISGGKSADVAATGQMIDRHVGSLKVKFK